MPERTPIITHTIIAAAIPLVFLAAACSLFLNQKYGIAFLCISLLASIVLVAVIVRRNQWLGAVLALATGLLCGVLLALVYGWTFRRHHLTTAGSIALAVLPALSALGFFLMKRAAEKCALRYGETEKNRAVRIILAGNLALTLGSAIAVIAVALVARAV